MSNRIVIIGNGFDAHHLLKTKYSDFKKSVQKVDKEMVEEVDYMLAEIGLMLMILNWTILQEMLNSILINVSENRR